MNKILHLNREQWYGSKVKYSEIIGVNMPHLRFRAIDFDTVKALSTELVDELQPLMDCPREDFTL